MLAVGAAVLLAGYSLLFWGTRIRSGKRIGLADAVIPGHYQRGPLPDVAGAPADQSGGTVLTWGPGAQGKTP